MTLTNYWWMLIWLFLAGAFFKFVVPAAHTEYAHGKSEKRWEIGPAIILIFPYIIWAGFRGNIGDTYAYRATFDSLPTKVGEWGDYLHEVSKDKGFSVLSLLIKAIVGNHYVAYFLILAVIQLFCIALVFRAYSSNYWFSIFIFIASTDYISWMFNGIRQFTAVTLIFAATPMLLKKKYVSVIGIILLAATIHGSALLMLPIVFIIQGKAWNKRALLCICLCILALLFVDQFTNMLDTLLSDTQYTNVVSDWEEWDDNGTNPIRVLVYSVPTILAIIGYKRIRREDNSVINMAVNASLISTGLYLVAMATSGIFLGRLPIYVSLYATGILLPWEIEQIFTRESGKLVKVAAVVCFIGFFYYQMHVTWGLL